ncbi:16S rRNA (guanine(527)-N(7))-methyltransferase RsmG [Flocculibacter collagenilyticus]|uniref:16S rRNA (guanine(527)-N(7))-methyltransferase RsmG n=1 Tax=Flocculibacter collagenilyticus TaxID=2744479 RepID=UPI0018F495FC|nr:16S rRNA (guanine(527)-N(7))-methyltransferase RsmG [Flocculibacter collagenilyticus]
MNSSDPTLISQLTALIKQTSLTVTESQITQLVGYVNLLHKWNKAYNLTSVRNPEEMLVKHIMDSLAVTDYLTEKRYIDVGTGPGLPGIPLAIVNPDKHFVLLDSLGKRVRFLNQVKLELGLTNIEPVQSRVEDYKPNIPLDAVLSRAFASISDMVNWCQHLIEPGKQFLAMKGQLNEQEMAQLPENVSVIQTNNLFVPQLEGERHLVQLQKQ